MELYKEHKKWVNYAKTFGAQDFAEDLVQDAYIKAIEKNVTQPQHFYIVLKNIVLDFHRQNKKELVPLPEYESLSESIYDYINTWYWYDRDLYLMYIEKRMVLREISIKTNISLASVHKTIKHCNEKLKKWYQIYGEN